MSTALSSVFKATRAKMIEMESSATTEKFEKEFHLKEGDYLEILHNPSNEWRLCRILAVTSCYDNRGGQTTAVLQVAILLRSGKNGLGRTVTLATREDGNRVALGPIWSCTIKRVG